MRYDLSRDFLDGILLQHPPLSTTKADIQANAGMHFLPSSPDGTMHTGVVSLRLGLGQVEKPFAQGGWRFLFTTSEACKPSEQQNEPFLQRLLILGASKILAVLNPLCLHANLPLLPLDANAFAQGLAAQQASQKADSQSA